MTQKTFTTAHEIAKQLEIWLACTQFNDYCPNGIHVDAFPINRPIHRLATAVTASMSVIEAAKQWQADALLVHHGYFWKNEPRPLTGGRYQRIRALIENGIALLAYHLPLDAHHEWGNNAQLARLLNLNTDGYFGEQSLGFLGYWQEALSLNQAALLIEKKLGKKPVIVGHEKQQLKRIAWCSGAAQSFFPDAIAAGVDAFITGEASEVVYHLAKESGVAFIAAGHHATEKYGVQALAAQVQKKYSCETRFFDENNPI